MRVALYARVSSKAQADRHTIQSQLRALRTFIAERGWKLVAEYVDDGRSAKAGKLERRDGFARLVADATAGRFAAVVVFDLDRLTRSEDITERGQVLGAFQRAGVQIAIASNGQVLDLSSSMGDLFSGLQAFFAAEENRKRAERIKAGKLRAIAEGKKPAGPTPFGYRYERASGRWSVDPAQAAIVREIFERVADGESCRAISDDMSARGLERPRGGDWGRERAWQIATARTYLGEWTADKERALRVQVPRIIEPDLFYRAQEALERHGKRGLRRTKHVYLLEGIAACGLCGARIGIAAHPARPTYVCARRRRPVRGESACQLPHRPTRPVDDALWLGLSAIILNPARLEGAVRRWRARAAADGATWRADAETAKAALARSQRAEEAILARFRRGMVSEAALDRELAAAGRERGLLERQVVAAQRAGAAAGRSTDAADALVDRLRSGVEAANSAERRELVAALVGDVPVIVSAVEVRAMLSFELFAGADVGHVRLAGYATSHEATNNLLRLPLVVRVAA